MGLDLGAAVNGAADWLCSAPLVRGVVSNPIFTALLIVALAAIVMMGLYHYQIKQAGLKRALRAFLYVFLLVLAVVFVHHYAVLRSAQAMAAQNSIREVFSGIEQSRASGIPGAVPVVPMGFEPRPVPAPVPATDSAPAPVSGGAPSLSPGAAPRPNNVAVADFVITDVIVPVTARPLAPAARA